MDYDLDYILDKLDREKSKADADPEKTAHYRGALTMAGAAVGHNIVYDDKTHHHRVLFSFTLDVVLGELDRQVQHLRDAHKEHDQGAKAFYDGLRLMASTIVTNHFAGGLRIVYDDISHRHSIVVPGEKDCAHCMDWAASIDAENGE